MRWFKHFTRAHRDAKIRKLINDYQADGYAVYFYALELIAERLESDNITFELEDDAELIGQYLHIDTLKVEKIMKRCVQMELFGVSEAGRITCFKIAKFLDERYTRSLQIKDMIKSDKMQVIKKKMSEDSLKTNGDAVQTKRDIPPQISTDKHSTDKHREEKAIAGKRTPAVDPMLFVVEEKFKELNPSYDTVVNFAKERKAIKTLLQRSSGNPQDVITWAQSMVNIQRDSQSEFWTSAPITPSSLLAKLSHIFALQNAPREKTAEERYAEYKRERGLA